MTVGESFTYQSKGSQATTPVLLLQPTERGAWWQLGQPTGWLATMHLSHAFLGDTSYAWEPYISGQYVSTMVYSFNALGCQLICNVGRQLESVLNIFTFLSTAINLRLPDLVNQPRYAKSAWIFFYQNQPGYPKYAWMCAIMQVSVSMTTVVWPRHRWRKWRWRHARESRCVHQDYCQKL